MKIALLSPLPPPNGGMATWTTIYLATEFAKNNGVYMINSAFVDKSINDFHRFHFLSECKRTLKILYRIIKIPKEIKIVHYCCPCNRVGVFRDLVYILVLKMMKKKVLLHCHCEIKNMLGRNNVAFSKIVKSCNKVICITKNSIDYVNNIENGKAIYIPNFAYIDHIVNDKIEIKKEIKEAIFVGHVTKEKGICELIELAKRYNNIKFKVVGFVDKCFEAPENVLFFGNVSHDNVIKEMKKSDIFVFPSHTEGFPNVILEAMSLGLPIVASKVGSIPLILDSQKELLCEPNDGKDLINKFEIAIDEKKRRKISQKNYENIARYFYNEIMNKYLKVYEEILDLI